MAEQAVIVEFDYRAANLSELQALDERLTEDIAQAGEGVCDGHDVTPDMSKATIYMYGPDAEFLFVLAQSVFEEAECVHNAVATLRFGPAEDGVPVRVIPIARKSRPNLRPW